MGNVTRADRGETDIDRGVSAAPLPAFSNDWGVAAVNITVPRSLSVSEAHGLKPRADIVWREDAPGDRYVQVEAIMRGALEPAFARFQGSVPVEMNIEVTRFHALTERARYTVGGQHEIEFVVTVRHAETGEVLSAPRSVDLTFRALGGRQAVEAEQQGITQRSRITEHLVAWVATEFRA
ncbi:DUF6778 family protein [Roseicyclus sediminis]|uniref:DUF6778 family protein n=1 Tax=Roseicyclus sediminis TaxID=2980997 RepID=UPI00292A5588|nr:DUF6778 family protein [Roseibacterium sp. SDUM158016]